MNVFKVLQFVVARACMEGIMVQASTAKAAWPWESAPTFRCMQNHLHSLHNNSVFPHIAPRKSANAESVHLLIQNRPCLHRQCGT